MRQSKDNTGSGYLWPEMAPRPKPPRPPRIPQKRYGRHSARALVAAAGFDGEPVSRAKNGLHPIVMDDEA